MSRGHIVQIPSRKMGRSMPVLVHVPSEYEGTDRAWPVVFLLHGYSDEWSAICEESLWGLYPPGHCMQELADQWQVIIVAPVTGNNYYIDVPGDPSMQVGTYVGEELPAYIDEHFRTQRTRAGRVIAGFSMGGYGAVTLYCRYPDTFCCCLTRAAAADPTFRIRTENRPHPVLSRVIGPYTGNEGAYLDYSGLEKVRKLSGSDVRFVVECGLEDALLETNRALRAILLEKKIPHIYSEHLGGHTWAAQEFRSLLCAMQEFVPTIHTPA